MNQIEQDYQFAKQTGYKHTLRDYINQRYKSYTRICKRNKITPMSQLDWETPYRFKL